MVAIVKSLADGSVIPTEGKDNHDLLAYLSFDKSAFRGIMIKNATFSSFGIIEVDPIEDIVFKNCIFKDVNLCCVSKFKNVIFDGCLIQGFDEWLTRKDIIIMPNCKVNVPPTNQEIEQFTGGKVFSLPNTKFVKVETECDFCHNKFYDIMARAKPYKMLKEVPQCNKRVCDQCYKNYDLVHKKVGNRHYGWSGPLSFYRTPIDAKGTEILGLEMEFEGAFWDWKGLQDAHRGKLHYGYDSSVEGQNELSWDCGSYSYWKYLAPLADVCAVIANGGGKPGPSAGIHIHVSTPCTDIARVTEKINRLCRSVPFRTLMECVSLRDNREKFERYANLGAPIHEHHAGISYNSHNTCEFRVFNSSLNPKIIMRHLKFCKEFYHMVKTNVANEKILSGFSKETKKHIMACADAQVKSGFVQQKDVDELIKKLGV